MGFGHRPNSHGAGQPSAKSLWSLAVSAKPSKVSASQHKSSKASASRPSLQRFRPPAGWPSLQRFRPPVGRPSLQRFWPGSHGLGQADTASGSRVGPDLSPVPVQF